MVGDLSFVTNEKDNVLYLPAKYILTENGNKFLFLNIAEWSFCWFLGFSMVTVYLLLKDLQQTKNKRNH